ncbi:MAG: glutamate-1-semialdehyde 2,1-aminomutase [Bacteroidia bacterium]|nr:glutamate-1-semialdehyde 2,1-aminomutase [Bacteroidia bacterium]
MYPTSKDLFERAAKTIPGGVNSPVRAFKSVGGSPLFIKKAEGAYLYDEDDRKYIDYIGSWGPMILGHAYPPVIEAIREQVLSSTSYGAPTRLEIEMAELICDMVPNVDLVRMVNSGTEACMSAIRLARGYTGRSKIIKFAGCYHGHGDSFLIKAGSGAMTLGIPNSPGVTPGTAQDTLLAPFNDIEAIKSLASDHKGEIAAIIVEPVAGNMGCIPPLPGYLEGMREICTEEGIVLIFDEVMTGFRLAPGGAQEYLNINADLVTLGKIIGAGMPVGAYGGKKEIMDHVAPVGPVYQAGTLSGNPIAMISGLTLLKELKAKPSIYTELDKRCAELAAGLSSVCEKAGIPYQINRAGSMISLHFNEEAVTDLDTSAAGDHDRFRKLFHDMLEAGIYLPPSPYESWFLSAALTNEDIEKTIETAKGSLF